MRAIHVNWTAPSLANHSHSEYQMNPFELLTSVSAALFWKRGWGEIVLYTDSPGLEFYTRSGIAEIYDDINVTSLDAHTSHARVEPARAPYSGKMHVLGSIEHEFVFMDLDFVLFDAGSFPYAETGLCCHHWELPLPPWYPPREQQFVPDGFQFSESWDFTALVPNISFLYVADPSKFFSDSVRLAIDYVTRSVAQNTNIAANKLATFANQRLMGMLAQERGLVLETLLNDMWISGPFGDHWEVVSRQRGLGLLHRQGDLISPFWVLDRSRFDSRKETVDCLHLWFEKHLYGITDPHTPRRRTVLRSLVERLESEFPQHRLARRLLEQLKDTRKIIKF